MASAVDTLYPLGKYIINILIGIDQLGNTLLGGDPDETISSRLGKIERKGKRCFICYWICRGLHLIDPGHCEKSIEEDEGGKAIR